MSRLVIERLSKDYPTRAEPLSVLRNIGLTMEDGANAAILGPSGSGKSTLLQILGTLQRPTTGTLRLNDVDPFQLGDIQLARFRNEQIGFIFQDHHLLPQLTALENVLIPVLAQATPKHAHLERARMLLDRVGLNQRLDHRPSELSGGERQRVAAARALINSPSLLLADEPTGNLDRTNANQIAELLCEIQSHDQNRPILLVVTHSPDLANYFERRWELNDGTLVAQS